MAIKHTDSCLQKAGDEEPIFVLRAQDILAPYCVRYWAERAIYEGVPANKIDEALELADKMEEWPNRKIPD